MEELRVMGLTIKRNGSPDVITSEKKCHYLDNGFCDSCSCDKCIGGVIINRVSMTTRDCECKIEAINRHRIKAAGLPEWQTFGSYRTSEEWQRRVKEKALAFLADDRVQGFYIAGQSGSGKTHICNAILSEMAKKGKKIMPFRWIEQARRIKALSNEPDRCDEELQRYLDADVLFIDDLFKQAATDADIGLAMRIIDDRYNRRRVTLISSERTLDEIRRLRDGDGEAIAGRIKEMCGEYCIMLRGADKNQRLK